ncbi:MAG: structural protein [Sideroxydans sp.]
MTRTGWLLVGLVASLALLGYQRKEDIKDMLTPRGIRNNNPGNIRHGSARWQGMSPTQTDTNFVQFITPEYGIRALSILIGNYYSKNGLNTVRKIISRYAPSSENNTDAYAQAVSKAIGVTPDTIINVNTHKVALVEAIIKHENGAQPYSMAQLNNGVMMA